MVDFHPLDRHGALVLVDTVAIEHADFHDRTGNARWQAKRGVAHVTRLFSEDGAEEFFFRRHRALALRRDLRSEEHTSELQSLMRISYAVFCLKKKNKIEPL